MVNFVATRNALSIVVERVHEIERAMGGHAGVAAGEGESDAGRKPRQMTRTMQGLERGGSASPGHTGTQRVGEPRHAEEGDGEEGNGEGYGDREGGEEEEMDAEQLSRHVVEAQREFEAELLACGRRAAEAGSAVQRATEAAGLAEAAAKKEEDEAEQAHLEADEEAREAEAVRLHDQPDPLPPSSLERKRSEHSLSIQRAGLVLR